MSKYLPLNLRWRFTAWNGFIQWRSLVYRIYINIFGIFLKIPLLPLGFDKIGFDFYRKGETVIYLWPWRRKGQQKWISICSEGNFNSLKEIDDFWKEYGEFEQNNLWNESDFNFEREMK